jgi:FtsH-binding integral membrane protein
MRLITTLALHTQLIIGLLLYILSPIVRYFLEHTREAMHLREIRFFGMEHISVMVVAIAVLTHGVIRIKKQPTDTARHRATAIWFTIALIMILSSVPWPFSPLIARPWLRL